MTQTILPRRQESRVSRKKVKKKKKRGFVWFMNRLFLIIIVVIGVGAGWLYLTPWGHNFRYLMADTLITTQHRRWAKYIIGESELQKRVAEYSQQFERNGSERDTHTIQPPTLAVEAEKPLVEIQPVSGTNYKGYVMIVHDPTKIRLGVPANSGNGEKVSSMVKRLGAVAGVNAGGFDDPSGKGNGFKPIGAVISQGKLYFNGLGNASSTQIVGIDKQGKMIAGHYSLKELQNLNVQEAVTFEPRLIVNGKGLIKSHRGGWGIAPRTAMGQASDGSIIFVVIDGRQPGYSIGADLYDVQKILLEHGAVIGANLDGGASSVLVKDGSIVNKPSSKYGERSLPTAFLVFNDPSSVNIPNVWKGLTSGDISPRNRK